jgi:hypothetical protein
MLIEIHNHIIDTDSIELIVPYGEENKDYQPAMSEFDIKESGKPIKEYIIIVTKSGYEQLIEIPIDEFRIELNKKCPNLIK